MGQITRAGGQRYITPTKSDGTNPDEHGRGIYTLTAGATYVYILGGASAPFAHVHLTGYTAGAIITATVQTATHQDLDVTDTNLTVGEWVSETPADGDVQVDGTGWTSSAAVVSADGTGPGGASWHLSDWPPFRTRIKIVVGGTGGDFRLSWHGKA